MSYGTGSLIRNELSELDQLRLFERKYDPTTVEVIEALAPHTDWRCLELGAGAGSIARWLAARVPHGSVVAVDLDTRHLTASGNLAVLKADVMTEEFAPGSFDLIHARALLEHLPERDLLFDRMIGWLAPGGWLVVEDFYYLPPADSPNEVSRALVEGYVRRLEEQSANMRWARGMPATLARRGLAEVRAKVVPAGPGQTAADDELIGLRMRQEGHVLVERGLVDAGQLNSFVGSLGHPGSWDVTALSISAWGRRL